MVIAAGSVSTQAEAIERTVAPLQPRAVGRHGPRYPAREDVGGRHRQTIGLGHADGDRRHQLGGRALGIGQVRACRCALPTVTTIRFQPTMVPRPRARATEILTQVGMNRVPPSSLPCKTLQRRLLRLAERAGLRLCRSRRSASLSRYISLRRLGVSAAGTWLDRAIGLQLGLDVRAHHRSAPRRSPGCRASGCAVPRRSPCAPRMITSAWAFPMRVGGEHRLGFVQAVDKGRRGRCRSSCGSTHRRWGPRRSGSA